MNRTKYKYKDLTIHFKKITQQLLFNNEDEPDSKIWNTENYINSLEIIGEIKGETILSDFLYFQNDYLALAMAESLGFDKCDVHMVMMIILGSTIFNKWIKKIHKNVWGKTLSGKGKIEIKGIVVNDFDPFKIKCEDDNTKEYGYKCKNKVGGFGFIKINLITEPWIPGTVVLRGDSVAILIVIKYEGKLWTVLTLQPRLAVGYNKFPEIPAGMIDGDKPRGAALHELEEETDIVIENKNLSKLKQSKSIKNLKFNNNDINCFYTSPGLMDESICLYVAHLDLNGTPEKFNSLKEKSKTFGNVSEGESINLLLTPLDDLPKITSDAKSLLAYTLYKQMYKGMFDYTPHGLFNFIPKKLKKLKIPKKKAKNVKKFEEEEEDCIEHEWEDKNIMIGGGYTFYKQCKKCGSTQQSK